MHDLVKLALSTVIALWLTRLMQQRWFRWSSIIVGLIVLLVWFAWPQQVSVKAAIGTSAGIGVRVKVTPPPTVRT